MPWAGWGAGPSGAGASGGPSRWFLVAALLFCAAVTAVLLARQAWPAAAVGTLAVAYFAARAFLGLGRRR